MNTVSEDLLSGIVYATTAFSVWADLKERFDKVNRMRIYQLHREITTLTQGTDFVSHYFTKLKTLWSEYDVVIPSLSYTCPQSKNYDDQLQQQRLIQFLSGLNDSYDQARRQIMLKGVTPSINQAYAIVIEDEIQHLSVVVNAVDKPESIALNVNKNQGTEYHKGKKCEFCHYTGHTKENCYKLIGYPEYWKQKRKSGSGYGNSSGSGYGNTRNASNSTSGGGYGRQSSTNNMNLRNAGNSGDYGGQHSANNASHNHYDYSQGPSTSQDESRAFMANGHAFTDHEYKQIMNMLNKEEQDP
ncbi:hypothetical protein KY284_011375 [Solanum tuberosum]|nr:hypothetical protein KY284_011375 [Solanum tuberosum]